MSVFLVCAGSIVEKEGWTEGSCSLRIQSVYQMDSDGRVNRKKCLVLAYSANSLASSLRVCWDRRQHAVLGFSMPSQSSCLEKGYYKKKWDMLCGANVGKQKKASPMKCSHSVQSPTNIQKSCKSCQHLITKMVLQRASFCMFACVNLPPFPFCFAEQPETEKDAEDNKASIKGIVYMQREDTH